MSQIKKDKLHIVIIGAGGIGSFYGSKLSKAGHNVIFIARGPHLSEINKKGLKVKHETFSFSKRVLAFSLKDFLEEYQSKDIDLILVCTKSMETAKVAKKIKPWLEPENTFVLSLQNGVDNEEQLIEILDTNNIIGGISRRVGAHVVKPGKIEAKGIGELMIGAYPTSGIHVTLDQTCQELKTILVNAKIEVELTNDIKKEIWKKLIINNGVNPLTALTGLDTKEVSHREGFKDIVMGMMMETMVIAEKEDVDLSFKDVKEMFTLIQEFKPIKTSMLIDVEKGRKVELEEISGHLINKAKEHGFQLPYTQTIYHLLKLKLSKQSLFSLDLFGLN